MNHGGLEALGPDELERADEILDRANHDIAKYMSMTARNVEPSAMGSDELAQLLDDLLLTDGRHSAWDLWVPLHRELVALSDDPLLAAIDRGMATIKALVEERERWTDGGEALVVLTVDVADRVAGLRRAVRQRLMEGAG